MPSIEVGGVEKNLFIISNYLAIKFSNLKLITISKQFKNNFNNKIKIIYPKSGLWEKLGRRTKFFICLILLFKEILKNNNTSVLCFQGNIYCTLLCKILNVKIIVRSNSSPSGWSKNFLKLILYKKILKLADKLIVNSQEFKKEFKQKFNLNSTCIYNPLNDKEIKKLSKKKIKFRFFNKKYLNIICVARFSEQKDHYCALRAIKILKNKIPLKILLIGDGEEKKNITNFIDKNRLKKEVKILNFKKNPFPYILNSDIFLLTSKYEGLPNVLLEAQVLRKLIISSNCKTGPSEILDYGKGGILFNVGNYEELAKKILYYYYNKKIFKKKIDHSNKKLVRFDYNKNLLKYYKTIRPYLN